MNKILLALLVLILVSCDNRPNGVYEGKSDRVYDALSVEHNGIKYLFFEASDIDRRGWVVDYSQFFTKDTLNVHGNVWVRMGAVEDFKPLRIPEVIK